MAEKAQQGTTASSARWHHLPAAPDAYFKQFPEYPRAVAQLLYNRGLTEDAAISRFLTPSYAGDLHNSRLLGGIDQAVGVILTAIAATEQIVIHGDYDADGITATAVLCETLRLLGARVKTFIPDRYVEGYGVAAQTLERLQREGAGLVITVDCGISSGAAIRKARARGLRVIVTDHHQPPAKPPIAEALINPHLPGDPYPNKNLTGVGVAFKLSQALLRESDLPASRQEAAEKWLLDLVAIGTVADVASLTGENRTLVKYGLLVLSRRRRPGLAALLAVAGIAPERLDAGCIGFAIAPRLNAAGRLTHAKHALQLLQTTDQGLAAQLARELNEVNLRRQAVTAEAITQARATLPVIDDDRRVVVSVGNWPSGIVGLVAGRLAGELSRPAFVIEKGETVSKGSARSIPALNIVDALAATRAHLTTYGGHAGAGGFSLPTAKLADFTAALEAYCRTHVTPEDLRPEVTIEGELTPSDLDFPLLDHLAEFEPFGIDNPKPQFLLKDAAVVGHSVVGKNADHLKLQLGLPDGTLTALAFGQAAEVTRLQGVTSIDLVGTPVANTFNHTKELEWHVTDFRPAGSAA